MGWNKFVLPHSFFAIDECTLTEKDLHSANYEHEEE